MRPVSRMSYPFGTTGIRKIQMHCINDVSSYVCSLSGAIILYSKLMAEITDNDLREFCRWYRHHYGKREDAESVFVTCLCGHFHSYPKAMKEVVKRMRDLSLIAEIDKTITIV